jgi:hypothetical protein
LLRVGAERRQEQAERENDREPDPPHGYPGRRMAGRSLADLRGRHSHTGSQ